MSSDPSSQWLFSLDALDNTPSSCSREKELYDRARGVEFLFRLGSSLQLLVLQLRSMPQRKLLMTENAAPLLRCARQQPGFTGFT